MVPSFSDDGEDLKSLSAVMDRGPGSNLRHLDNISGSNISNNNVRTSDNDNISSINISNYNTNNKPLGPVTTTTSAAARTTAYYISNFSSNNNALACNKLVRK